MDTTTDSIFFNPIFSAYYATEIMAKNFIAARFLNTKQIDKDTVLVHKRKYADQGEILSAIDQQPRPLSEGTELTEIKGTEMVGETLRLNHEGFKLQVTEEEMNSDGYSLEDNIRDISFTLAKRVEDYTVKALKEKANAHKAKDADIGGNWADRKKSTLDTIQADIVEMQSAYDEMDYADELNCFIYNKKEFNAIRKNFNYEVSKYDVESEQGYYKKPLDFCNAMHHSSKHVDEGTCFGMDVNTPPATIYYKVDPALASAPFYNGVADYAPFVETFVRDHKGISKTKYREIEFGVSFGVSVDRPSCLLYEDRLGSK